MNSKRKQAQDLILKVMDTLDKTGANTAYYQNKFKSMSDVEFQKWASKALPIRFHTKPFEIEPKMYEIEDALKILGVPLLEKVALPYLYVNKSGEPVWSKEAMVVYIHIKKMKQFITKKNATPLSIDNRDMKSGLLVSHDKGGKSSDREMEAMVVMGMDKTMKEMSTIWMLNLLPIRLLPLLVHFLRKIFLFLTMILFLRISSIHIWLDLFSIQIC